MRRHYTRELVVKVVAELKTVKDDPFIAADVIAGFPGETDKDFGDTLSLIESLGLSKLHAFPYSKRPGTAAADFPDQLPSSVITGRTRELLALSDEMYRRYTKRWVGKKTEVLIQEKSGDEEWTGLSENYLPTRIKLPAAPYAVKPGSIVPVTLESSGAAEMIGKIRYESTESS
jgi:threonylcarbamoyladenosine tRNA methylthiotransferase MtaB